MEINLARATGHYSDGSMSSMKFEPVAIACSMSPKTPAMSQEPPFPAMAVLSVPMMKARSLSLNGRAAVPPEIAWSTPLPVLTMEAMSPIPRAWASLLAPSANASEFKPPAEASPPLIATAKSLLPTPAIALLLVPREMALSPVPTPASA